MDFLRSIWKQKQTKIGFAAVCVAAILTAAFFFAPGAGKQPNVLPEATDGSASPGSAVLPLPSTESAAPAESAGNGGTTESGGAQSAPCVTRSEVSAATPPSSSAASSLPGMAIDPKTGKDKYQTDPVPEGKPLPVEPENAAVDRNRKYTCTLSIRCDTILNNMELFNKDKLNVLPKDGTILLTTDCAFAAGESVFDVLKRVTREKRVHMEFRWTPIYNSAYIAGIHNLYEFDCGDLSGWMYKVNGWFPNYGASRYSLKQGDVVEWVYTCDLGRDVGGYYAVGGG
jgi:hypothetical protein